MQTVKVPDGKKGDTYVASAFAKAESVPAEGWQFTILVRFKKEGQADQEVNILFNSYSEEWQKVSGAAKAENDYTSVEFWLLYYGNGNAAYFDNAQLIKDTFGNTYTYDEEGNLISTKDLQDKEDNTFTYDGNNQLIKETSISGSTIDYTYDTAIPTQLNRVSSGGVTVRYSYDSFGNVVSMETLSGENEPTSNAPSISTTATYTANGEYLTGMTDSRGNSSSYTYNQSRGYITAETDPKNVTTNYTYNGSELLTGVSVANGTQTSSVAYTYDTGKKLSSIVSPSGTAYSFIYDGFGRTTATKVGSRTLSTYTYNAKGLPATMTYGNGVTVSYGYDDLNRQTAFYVNNNLKYQYRYDGMSRLSEVFDLSLFRTTRFEYDILGRPTTEKLINSNSGEILAKLNIRYDDTKNRLAGYDVSIGGTSNAYDYVYNTADTIRPDNITGVKRNGEQSISYTYDHLNRLSSRRVETDEVLLTQYTYLQGDDERLTTPLVSRMNIYYYWYEDWFDYAYDEVGNITQIQENGVVSRSYTYDALNQLKTATYRNGDVYSYNYDNGGNILSVTKNGTTVKTYTYGDSQWKDLLTAYNGNTITYDNIGNPTYYHDLSTFTWSSGRKLVTINNGATEIRFTYDVSGLRTSKTVNDEKTEYYWLDGMLYAQKTGDQYVYFHYDENGTAYGFTVKEGTTTADYYYMHNLQGDVIGIFDNVGEDTIVRYTYDEWGKVLTITGDQANTIGQLNPIRYRGYYYDIESGFYYCQSRYYDPETGRFINADGYISTGQGILSNNMFAYCGNNPVNYMDPTGQSLVEIWEGIKSSAAETWKVMKSMGSAYSGFCSMSLADGALPFGDVVTIAGVTILTATAIVAGTYTAITAPALSVPKSREKVQEKTQEKALPPPKISYWTAVAVGNTVIPLIPLTYSEARSWVESEGDLLCINHAAAYAIVKFYPSAFWEPAHRGGVMNGYLNHYHMSKAHKNHIWYYGV